MEQGGLAVRAARASGNEVALAAAFDGYKSAVAYVGDIDALVPVIEELEPMLRRQGDPLRLHWTTFESAFPALAAGDWPAALARLEDSLVIGRRIGSMAHASWHLAIAGGVARLRAGWTTPWPSAAKPYRRRPPCTPGPPRGRRRTRHHAAGNGARDEAIAC